MEKMVRQIRVYPEDRDLRRILWRQSSNSRAEPYRLTTVTYGLACAPYLALRVMRQLALDERDRFPRGSDSLLTDVYVDDVLWGADDVTSVIEKQQQVIELLKAGGFSLRRCASNSRDVLSHLSPTVLASGSRLAISSESSLQLLGLSWNADTDSFGFHLSTSQSEVPRTKRTILSAIASLFDPLGWLSPVIVRAKIFLQSLWLLKIGWDDVLPDNDAQEWFTLYSQLPHIADVRIPRWLNLPSTTLDIEIHGFADASECAYAAVVYLVVGNPRSISLVAAKTKVAPIKQVSLPRLELCAAQLLSKLTKRILETLLRAQSTFEIQRLLPDALWKHVESKDNPADCASRGILASELHAHRLWWTGPPWLRLTEDNWPARVTQRTIEPSEQRVIVHIGTVAKIEPIELISRYSSFTRLQCIFSWCLCFITNSRKHTEYEKENRELSSTLRPKELAVSLSYLVKLEQARFFSVEVAALKSRASISKGPLLKLNPYFDEEGQLRGGGRLRHATLDADERHPIIIPRESLISTLLIDKVHRTTLHGATATQLMGDLPQERVTPSRPFYHTGVDYAGPIFLRTSKGRGHESTKAYIAVFVCFATGAVHLEAVSDYSTDTFLAAYKRFVSRRGLCKTISSDCGATFVGADAEPRALFDWASSNANTITAVLANDRVEWRFNPPSAPHFGGIWEAAVKSTKHHLRRVIGETTLTFEEMTTLLTQIEACLNSKPLNALTDDPEDLNVLTPGHFLVGGPLSAVPEPDLNHVPTPRLSRWQLIQQMRDGFWKRWSTEYLHRLQARPKWTNPRPSLAIGDLVLIVNKILAPTKWPVARINATHPGKDGHVRVASVKTATSTFKRPIVKLCLLLKREDIEKEGTRDN